MTPIETFVAAVKHIASKTHDDAAGYGLSVALLNFERDQGRPIPDGVYYRHGNFYDAVSRQGKGVEFFNEWIHRAGDFPGHPEAVKK